MPVEHAADFVTAVVAVGVSVGRRLAGPPNRLARTRAGVSRIVNEAIFSDSTFVGEFPFRSTSALKTMYMPGRRKSGLAVPVTRTFVSRVSLKIQTWFVSVVMRIIPGASASTVPTASTLVTSGFGCRRWASAGRFRPTNATTTATITRVLAGKDMGGTSQ